MNPRLLIFIVPLLLVLISCNSGPVFPLEPNIEFVDIQPREVQQFTDSIVITIRFTDGDGDLGDEGSGAKNLVVKDNRTQFPDSLRTIFYTIPNLTPDAKNPSIQGNFIITVAPTIITPGLSEDQTDFSIYVFDRADNKSNEIVTDPIKIIP